VSKPLSPTCRTILITAIVALLLMASATQYRQWTLYSRGTAAEAANNPIAAISGYESAIHMYTPGSPFVARSAEALWNLGLKAEARRDVNQALIAYRALRSSFYASRSFFLPGQEWIQRCNEKIVTLEQQLKTADRSVARP
jgi:tetratricopeptide (TPR) repeat protein